MFKVGDIVRIKDELVKSARGDEYWAYKGPIKVIRVYEHTNPKSCTIYFDDMEKYGWGENRNSPDMDMFVHDIKYERKQKLNKILS